MTPRQRQVAVFVSRQSRACVLADIARGAGCNSVTAFWHVHHLIDQGVLRMHGPHAKGTIHLAPDVVVSEQGSVYRIVAVYTDSKE